MDLKDYIPKNDVQQSEFLKKYPNYGRGLLIAIIDKGFDVSLPGFKQTSTGLPKILDCFDLSGAKDVDTSSIKKTTAKNNTLVLLSGREVKIPSKWKNPSRRWHLGIKPVHEIIPKVTYENVNPEWQKAVFGDTEFPKPKKSARKTFKNKVVGELIPKDSNVDCVVWNDGKKWRACLITSDITDIKDAKVLTNFCDEHEYCFILDQISRGISIENNGNLLKIFIPETDHGTIVAHAAAAHFPGEPERDGLAPGAQIVSFLISKDETATLLKNFLKCIELGVNIINMSFGYNELFESKTVELIKEMVQKHGIIIVQCVGNRGPYFSSIRSDSTENDEQTFVVATSNVGSAITFEIKSKIYKITKKRDRLSSKCEDKRPLAVFPYSSRGPCYNGDRGITFVAPGCAITATPK